MLEIRRLGEQIGAEIVGVDVKTMNDEIFALAIPSRGGDTYFASLYAAYDALPVRLRQRIEGLEKAASDALVEELEAYTRQPGGQYTHKWSKGDIVIWDNR